MKRILALIALVGLLGVVAGCNQQSDTKPAAPDTNAVPAAPSTNAAK